MKKMIVTAVAVGLAAATAWAGFSSTNASPTNYIAGYNCDGTNITIPLATFSGLSAAEANNATGDVRKVIYHFTEMAYTSLAGLASSNRPVELVMGRQGQEVQGTNLLQRVYSVVVNLVTTTLEVNDE